MGQQDRDGLGAGGWDSRMIMPDEWIELREKNAAEWLLGDAGAITFIRMFMQAVEAWDDLIDEDTDYNPAQINEAFLCALYGIPALPFYQRHAAMLQPLILIGINAFHDSNILCTHEQEKMRNMAFHLRNYLLDLYIMCAFIVGGYEHMRKVSVEIREFFAFETFKGWDTWQM